LIDPVEKRELKGIEALVRSLARQDSCFCIHYHQNRNIEECDLQLPYFVEEEEPCLDRGCGEKQFKYDSKLKVTFGSGTWTKSCSEVASEGCIHNCEKCVYNGEIKDIIEPLRKIEQLCHELGVQCYYE
jgi:hypothetical protein